MRRFYCLGEPYSDKVYTLYGDPTWASVYGSAEWSDRMDDSLERIECPLNPDHRRSGKRLTPLVIVLPSPKLGDFVWTWYSDCLVTDKVMQLFREAGLTGFTGEPVTVEKVKRVRKGKPVAVPTLHELVVVGRGGEAHPDSGIHVYRTCEACGWKAYSSFRNGIIVEEKHWDGADFFTVDGYRKFILVTERVKELIMSHRLTNCVLTPSHELQWGDDLRPEEMRHG